MLESLVGILAINATLFGLIMAVSGLPQAFKMIRRKSSADVSIITYLMLIGGATSWLLYGLSLADIPIIVSNAVGLISTVFVMSIYFVYKK